MSVRGQKKYRNVHKAIEVRQEKNYMNVNNKPHIKQ